MDIIAHAYPYCFHIWGEKGGERRVGEDVSTALEKVFKAIHVEREGETESLVERV